MMRGGNECERERIENDADNRRQGIEERRNFTCIFSQHSKSDHQCEGRAKIFRVVQHGAPTPSAAQNLVARFHTARRLVDQSPASTHGQRPLSPHS